MANDAPERLVTKRGNRLYEPDGDVLTAFFWSRAKLTVIQGPIGSGTSTASCMKIWSLACEQEPDDDNVRRTRWIISRSTYKELEETTIATWLIWFPENEWGRMTWAEPANHHLNRKHPSGDGTTVDCEVIFLAIPDDETAERVLASFEITGFFVNEGQNTSKFVVTELLSRCSRFPSKRDGPGATWFGGLVDLNAPIEGHWIPYMRGDVPIPTDWDAAMKAEFAKPDNWEFFTQPPGLIETWVEGKIVYQPNPKAENQKWLTEPYIEKISGWDKAKIDRRVMNKVGLHTNGKAVYPTFSDIEHVSKIPLRPIENWPIIVGLDFGREPAAAFCQNVNGHFVVLSELIGENESAELFAPKVKRHLAQHYPGFSCEFSGDPRGADGSQNSEMTAYEIFNRHGMRVFPATTDNNPQMRRSAMEGVLGRRNGFLICTTCLVAKTGLAGGYHYPQIKVRGISGLFSDKPRKDRYSHIVEAIENAALGAGEGEAVVRSSREKPKPSPVRRHRIQMRSAR